MTLNNDNETEVKTKNLKATTFQNTELYLQAKQERNMQGTAILSGWWQEI